MVTGSFAAHPSALIVKPSAMGDIIHTFPVVRAIKKATPGVAVDWVVADRYAELAALSPYVDEILPFRRSGWARWWKASTVREVAAFIRNIRGREYGAVLDLQGLLRSGLITFFTRAERKVGFAYAREGAKLFYDVKIPPPEGATHAIDRYMSALAGLDISPDTDVAYDLVVPERESLWAEMVTPSDPYVVINPNARWETKRWTLESFGELMRRLTANEGLRCVIIGGPDDVERGGALAEMAGPGAVNLAGAGGLAHLAAVLKKAECVFTNDSGPLHLAVALQTPTVSIFGPTDPALTGPYGSGHAVLRRDIDCSPCLKRRCPYHHECMKELPVDDVMAAWRALNRDRETGVTRNVADG